MESQSFLLLFRRFQSNCCSKKTKYTKTYNKKEITFRILHNKFEGFPTAFFVGDSS